MPRLRSIILSLVVAALASAGTAGATTITVNTTGPSPTTGTATTGFQLRFNTARRTLNCTSGELTMTRMTTVTGTAPLRFGTVTPVLPAASGGSCTMTGGVSETFACLPGSVEAVGSSTTPAGVTQVRMPGMSCVIAVALLPSCRANLNGSAFGQFDNTTHQLRIFVAAQTLIVSGSTDGMGHTCGLLPNDSSIAASNPTGGDLIYQYSTFDTIHVP
jgi:hypothetical protein